MGSFNQICALSGLPIQPGDRVKLLFLTKSPYQDGECYSNDKFFVRTFPIDAVYDDYGNVDFEENRLTDIICEIFRGDIVCKPMGENQCHEYAVDKNFTFNDLLEASSQNKLQVYDGYGLAYKSKQKLDKRIPTWKRVEKVLEKNNLTISKKEDCLGYGTIPVSKGIVKVIFHNSYDKDVIIQKLKDIQPLFDKKYQTKITWNVVSKDYNDEYRLLVYPKDVSLLNDFEEKITKLTSNTTSSLRPVKPLKVKRILILEKVWNAYLNCEPEKYSNFPKTAQIMFNDFKNNVSEKKRDSILDSIFTKYYRDVPFQISLDTHLEIAIKSGLFNEEQMDKIILSTCECIYIQGMLDTINKPWDTTLHGNQSPSWEVHSSLLKSFDAIVDEMIAEKERQEKEWETEDE